MRAVPRHQFVPAEYLDQAYADHPLPIGYGQTISQPYIVALMTEALDPQPDQRVLEIGTGSGYQAAVLAELGIETYTIEIIPELAQQAEQRLANLGYDRVHVRQADGYFGWEEHAPYDAIIVTAAPDHLPTPLSASSPTAAAWSSPSGRPAATRRSGGSSGTGMSCWPPTWAASASCRSPGRHSSRSQSEWPGTPPVSTWRPSGRPTRVVPDPGHAVAPEPNDTESRNPGGVPRANLCYNPLIPKRQPRPPATLHPPAGAPQICRPVHRRE